VARPLVLSCLLLTTVLTAGGEVRQAAVQHEDGVYILALDVMLSAPFEAVYAIVSDYDRLYRISEVLVETRLLPDAGDGLRRRRLVTRTCILIFCFTARMVETVQESGNAIFTRIVPGESDFKSGRTEWHVLPLDARHSRIRLYSELEPDFWIPPFIGPYLLKRKMLSEARKSIRRIEALAADG